MTAEVDRQQELEPSRFAWRYLDRVQARQLWDELADWVGWVRERYECNAKIPPCWYRHGPVVEELSALMVAWTQAYYRGDEYRDDLTAWHTQWFWPVIGRIRQITDFETCTHSCCTSTARPAVTLYGFTQFVDEDVADRPVPEPPEQPRPEPTGADISVAQEVRSISEEDMETAVEAGAASVVDHADPNSAVTYEGIEWIHNTRLGAWVPSA